MKKSVASGKTIEDAVRKGLRELQATEDQVSIVVLEQPSRGLFGLIGTREAKVELTLKPQPVAPQAPEVTIVAEDDVEEGQASGTDPEQEERRSSSDKAAMTAAALDETEIFLRDVALTMGLAVDIDRKSTRDGTKLTLSGPEDIGMLIGRRGQTLDALQYLANIIANRHSDSHLRIVLDAEDFRERRRKTLEELANRLAGRVARSREEVVLEPMSSHERKIIHAQLQHHPKVTTYSKGNEPNRRIVITPK